VPLGAFVPLVLSMSIVDFSVLPCLCSLPFVGSLSAAFQWDASIPVEENAIRCRMDEIQW